MKRLSLALSLAMSLAAMVALQAQQAQQPSPTAKGEKTTVTGCLERAVRDAPVGTSGAGSTTATGEPIIRADAKWILTEPSKSKKASGEAAGTSGSHRAKVAYRLDVPDESSVAQHEGHKVEISGTVEDQGAGDSKHQAPLLKLESVKMIASSCAGE